MNPADDKILNILTQAHELIASPTSWCQGADAKGNSGISTGALDADATRWCAAGAMSKAKRGFGRHTGDGYLFRAASMWKGSKEVTAFDLAAVNDLYGWKAVMETYDIACSLRLNDLALLEGADEWNPDRSASSSTMPTSAPTPAL